MFPLRLFFFIEDIECTMLFTTHDPACISEIRSSEIKANIASRESERANNMSWWVGKPVYYLPEARTFTFNYRSIMFLSQFDSTTLGQYNTFQ